MTAKLKEKINGLITKERVDAEKIWVAVRSILKGKKIDPVSYQRKMRRELEQ